MTPRLTPRMCKAARSLVGWGQGEFADASGLSKSTIGAFEAKDEEARMSNMNNKAAVEAFERAGLEFIPENGGGAGVRFRERKAPAE